VWRTDRKEIDYIAPDARVMAVPIESRGATLEAGTPVALFQTRIVGGGAENNLGRQYDVARDGRFLINTSWKTPRLRPSPCCKNWRPPAK